MAKTTAAPLIEPEYPVHPLAALFPMMAEDELAELAEDIKTNGLVHPIVRGAWKDDDGTQFYGIVDGRNRLAACLLGEVEPRFTELNGQDPAAFIVSANLARRNLTKGQQAMLLAMAHPASEKGGRGKKAEGTKAAETSGFTERRLQQARAVLHHSREMALAVVSGGTSLDEALAEMAKRLKEDADPVARIEALKARYPDLAVQVTELQLSLQAAEVEANVRDRQEAERREAMLRAGEQALYFVRAFAVDSFVDGLMERLGDDIEFYDQYVKRLRLKGPAPSFGLIKELRTGFGNLIAILRFLGEEEESS